jgi:hypothetical protein
MITSAWITVLPPRIMFVVPMIWERRETLFPVSCGFVSCGRGWRGLNLWDESVERELDYLLSRCTRLLQASWTSCLHVKLIFDAACSCAIALEMVAEFWRCTALKRMINSPLSPLKLHDGSPLISSRISFVYCLSFSRYSLSHGMM